MLPDDAKPLPPTLLVEADLFISYLTGDNLQIHFQRVVEAGASGRSELLVSSEVYDDVITALRSQEVSLATVIDFVRDMKSIPHRALPVTLDVASSALGVYREHGGSRRLHYFDSFHVATSQVEGLPLVTSDKYILSHAEEFGIRTLDAREV